MAYIVKVDNHEYKIDVKPQEDRFKDKFIISSNGKERKVEVVHQENSKYIFIIDNTPYQVTAESDDSVMVNDETYQIEIIDEQIGKLIKARPAKFKREELVVRAAMPGLIISVNVNEGDKIHKGAGVIVIEAMKMQNEMRAPRDGIVKQILIQKGCTVNSGDKLIVIE